jgi:hypothetical protein
VAYTTSNCSRRYASYFISRLLKAEQIIQKHIFKWKRKISGGGEFTNCKIISVDVLLSLNVKLLEKLRKLFHSQTLGCRTDNLKA